MVARFQNLTVKAFRSVGESLTFDLHSPLTLVYAPNGTGKTTLCEAAEWMLTGEVERLSVTTDFNVSTLTSRFLSPPQPTEVSANFLNSDGIGYLSRKLEGAAENLRVGESIESSIKISSKDWLERISSNLEIGQPGLTASEKTIRRWIRGSRFLTIDDLASLMDADDLNHEKRMQVFSDLLGVRHLFDATKVLSAHFDGKDDELKVLHDALSALEIERSNLKDLEKNLIESPVIYWAGFDKQLAVIEEKVTGSSLKANTLLSTGDRIEELGSILLGQDQENRNKLNIAAQIDGHVSGRPRDVSLAQELGNECAHLKKIITDSQGSIAKQDSRITRLKSDIMLNEKCLSVFPGMRIVVEGAIKEFLAAFELHSDTLRISKANSLRKLRKLISKRSIAADLDSDSSHLRILNILKRDLPALKNEIKNLSSLRKKTFFELGDTEEKVQITINLEEAEQNFAKLLKELHAIEQPLTKLQIEVKAYLSGDNSKNTSDCPVCGCEHGTSESLLSAMNKVMASLPKLIESKRSECQLVAAKKDYWARQLDVKRNLRIKIEEIDRDLEIANNREKSLMAGLGLYGISSRDPKNSIDKEMAREELAVKLFELLSSVGAIEQAFPDFEQLSSSTVEELFVTNKLHEYQRKQEEIASNLRMELMREMHHLNGFRSTVELNALRLRDVEVKLGHSQRKLNDVNVLWGALTGEKMWSQDRFTKIHKQLLDKERELKLFRKNLDEISRQFASSQAMLRRDEIDKKLSELYTKLSTTEDRQRLTLRARDAFNLEYDKVTKERLSHLSNSVAPLFMRMHSNRIYDSIAFKEGGQSGLLKATSAGDMFNPYADFSQGQRQDLALAIFLARARAVGGTFFLDEPVMHLDDLNRVALLDILRAFTLENFDRINLVVTTSSKALTRHMIQKFSSVDKLATPVGKVSPLTVYALEGNALTGVVAKKIYGG